MLTTNTANPRLNVPNAWYDLSCRVSAALAVANVCIDYLPAAQGQQEHNCDITGNLVVAMHDLLELCQKDVLQLEGDLLKMGRDG